MMELLIQNTMLVMLASLIAQKFWALNYIAQPIVLGGHDRFEPTKEGTRD